MLSAPTWIKYRIILLTLWANTCKTTVQIIFCLWIYTLCVNDIRNDIAILKLIISFVLQSLYHSCSELFEFLYLLANKTSADEGETTVALRSKLKATLVNDSLKEVIIFRYELFYPSITTECAVTCLCQILLSLSFITENSVTLSQT